METQIVSSTRLRTAEQAGVTIPNKSITTTSLSFGSSRTSLTSTRFTFSRATQAGTMQSVSSSQPTYLLGTVRIAPLGNRQAEVGVTLSRTTQPSRGIISLTRAPIPEDLSGT